MKSFPALAFLLFFGCESIAQSLETYAGHKRAGVDLMWFRFFKTTNDKQTPVLFFSRNRASTDYHDLPTVFGSVNAVSYNFKNGMGMVAVASFVNNGFVPKGGIQYYKASGDFLFFGWLVADMKNAGNIDLFGMLRYQPELRENLKLFLQLELFPVYSPLTRFWNLTQRARAGIRKASWTTGLMADFTESGAKQLQTRTNAGGFLRYDF